MVKIVESKVLIRTEAPVPEGFKVATEDFHSDWSVMKSGGTQRLERKIRAKGWALIRLPGGTLRSGVGKSAQDAIAKALLLALRRLEDGSNAVEITRLEVTEYPWFCLARLTIVPYSMRQHSHPPTMDHRPMILSGSLPRSVAPRSVDSFGAFASAMPMLKQILTSGRNLAAAE